jgi:hypothetical protein
MLNVEESGGGRLGWAGLAGWAATGRLVAEAGWSEQRVSEWPINRVGGRDMLWLGRPAHRIACAASTRASYRGKVVRCWKSEVK